MKFTINNIMSIVFMSILIISIATIALSAIYGDIQEMPGQARAADAASSLPAISNMTGSTTPSASQEPTQQTKGSLGEFAQLWSSSDSAQSITNKEDVATSLQQNAKLYSSPEFQQLKTMMNKNNFDGARRAASTPEMRSAVEREYQMHLEMHSTELLTAKADHEKGSTKEP